MSTAAPGSWPGQPCPLYAGPDRARPQLAIGVSILAGTVLFADGGADRGSRLPRGSFLSQNTNTTQPAIDALRDFTRWNRGRLPDLLLLHSTLRDIYRLCRTRSPEADEAAAGSALAALPHLQADERASFAANFARLLRTLKGVGGATLAAFHTLPALDTTQRLDNACMSPPHGPPEFLNGLVAQLNELTREVAAATRRPCFDWARWLDGVPPAAYMRPASGGPHVVDRVLVELFRAMMATWQEAAAANLRGTRKGTDEARRPGTAVQLQARRRV